MSFAWRLLGMSRGSKKYAGYIQSFQAEAIPRQEAYKAIQKSLDISIPEHRFNTEWGILKSAQNKWDFMNTYSAEDKVRVGYQRVLTRMSRRHKSIIKFEVLNQKTGETFDMYTTVYHDRQMKRSSLRRKGIKALLKATTTKLEFLKDTFTGGYLSK